MAELLLELFSEEIPARMQDRAREDLARLLGELLAEAGLAFDQPIRGHATPRRLTIVATGLPRRQPDRVVERKGPRADAPEQARAGFLRGLAGVEHTLEEREDRKARVLFAVIRERGREVGELLAELVPQAIQRLPWPKSMRWGAGDFRWVRPLHSILCLCDGRVVSFEVDGVRSGDATRGHRLLAPEPFAVRDFADYVVRVREAKVILDGAERREIIAHEAEKLAASEGLVVADAPALLDELKGLVEWPVPLLGAIDEPFMELPPEVLISTMRNNQKYLALRTRDGALAPRFVLVANTIASDGGAAIVAGNERVLRARLWDAKFFWDQDRKQPLESRLPALDKMVFHAELGSLGERAQRLVALSGALAPHVPGADRSLAERAALLAKADLVTGMVGEFPELQGVMGGHYARAQGEPEPVAAAIRDQYAPKGPDDVCPTAPESVALAIADRLDVLVGFFGIDIMPTGSKDPFALRRTALGLIRIVIENQLKLPLWTAIRYAYCGYETGARPPAALFDIVHTRLLEFVLERLRVYLRTAGIRHDVVSAVYAASLGPTIQEFDLVRLIDRAKVLQEFLATSGGADLLATYKRASNIVRAEEQKDGIGYSGLPRPALIQEPVEGELLTCLTEARQSIETSLKSHDVKSAMLALAAIREPIDAFFNSVLVNVEDTDIRANRLNMLSLVRSALNQIADFSVVEDSARSAA